MTINDAIRELENFLADEGGAYDWDDFTTLPIKDDPYLEEVRTRCFLVRESYPPAPGERAYCNAEGRKVIAEILNELRSRAR